LRAEHEGFRCITVDLDGKEKKPPREVADLLFRVYEEHLISDVNTELADSEFVEKDGVLHIKRAIEDVDSNNFLVARTDLAALPPQMEKFVQPDRHLRLKLSEAGSRSSYVWEDDATTSRPLKRTEIEMQVQASSLDATDISIINGQVVACRPGQECSGLVTKVGSGVEHLSVGDHVVAWSPDTFSTHIRAQTALVSKIPGSMSFEVAATIPLAYATAWYSLVHTGRLSAGEKVFIHEAADPVGQAAVHIASIIGAEIYVTARSDKEKAWLAQTFDIPMSHIFSSENTDFVSALRRLTKGHGLDVVLNRSSDEVLQATFSCVAPFGRFIDLSKSNAQNNERLEMAPFAKNVSFTSVDMGFLYDKNIKLAGKIFQEAMKFVTKHGLPATPNIDVKPWSKLAEAMELVQNEKHVERVVMVPEDNDLVLVSLLLIALLIRLTAPGRPKTTALNLPRPQRIIPSSRRSGWSRSQHIPMARRPRRP